MHLLLVGISHRTAPVELRERVDLQSRGVAAALGAISARGVMREAVVLSTCNRVELYGVCDDLESAPSAVVQFLSEFHAVSRESLEPHVYSVADADVARHLFRVAAGLDSMKWPLVRTPSWQRRSRSAATYCRSPRRRELTGPGP